MNNTTAPMERYDAVIVGGGPAGMAAAWELRDCDVLLVEKAEKLGGRIRSMPRGDYWLNLGSHLFAGPGSRIRALATALGLTMVEIPGDMSAIAVAGKIYSRKPMSRLPLLLPLTLRERWELLWIGAKISRSVKRWLRSAVPKDDESEPVRRARVASMLTTTTFRHFIGAPSERVDDLFRTAGRRAASDIDQHSAGVGISLFSAVWSGKNSMAFNLEGGSELLPDAMRRHLADTARYDASVTKVRCVEGGAEITYRSGDVSTTVFARQVIMAVPAPVALAVVQDVPADVAVALGEISYGPFLSLGLMSNIDGPLPIDDIYALMTPGYAFDMLMNHANPVRGQAREPGGSLMVYAGGSRATELMCLTDSQISELFLADVYKICPDLRGTVVEALVQRWPIGNVYRRPGVNFEPMLEYCDRTDTTVHYCGDYFAELGNMEVAASSGVEAAARARAQLVVDPEPAS